jgi:hypothetical protein
MNLSINYLRVLRETNPNLFNHYFKIAGHNLCRGYVRIFGLANKLARVQLTIPYVGLAGKVQLNGRDTTFTKAGYDYIIIFIRYQYLFF